MRVKEAGRLLGWSPTKCRISPRRAASAMAVPTSDHPDMNANIQSEASLPNPDPASDSQTSALVSAHAPYMVSTYKRPPPMMVKGEGSYLYDIENRRYLDFTAGIAVTSLGHSDPEISKLLRQQSQTLVHCSNLYHNAWIGELSKLIVKKTVQQGGMQSAAKVFICNSGSEANEAAIKFARKVGKIRDPTGNKTEILSFTDCFHGRTMGSLSATPNPKYQTPFSPMIPGFKHTHFNDTSNLDQLITPKTCGVIIEPIQGEGGINVATPHFLQSLRDRCNAVGAVLIYDEIQCGLSRTGNLWAHQTLGPETAHPDILTTAKALGNGFPIGATMVSEDVAQCVVTGDHGTTFGGNPLACRVAHHIFSRLSDPALQSSVKEKSEIFQEGFQTLRKRFPTHISEVRGHGLILGLQLNSDPTPIVTAARERGLLVITCGRDTLRFVPPLTIIEEEIREGMEVLGEAMGVVWGEGMGEGEKEGGEGKEKVEGTRGQQEMAPEGR